MEIKKVVIIGSGNVATNLAEALFNAKIKIIQIISRTLENAKQLANIVNCEYATDLGAIKKADLYIISTSDDSIKSIANHVELKNKFVVHTAGSVPVDILSVNSDNFGVFYPLQTFKKKTIENFKEIPICIEASNNKRLSQLEKLALTISKNIYFLNSKQRLKIHVSAVFVNNFINHLMAITNDYINNENINKDILKPLLNKTFKNISNKNPAEIQTGPAIRNDQLTIQKHLDLLEDNTNMQKIYKALTDSIINFYTE